MTTQPKETVCMRYLSDLGKLLVENARGCKEAREKAANSASREFESGRLLAYNEVISLMQQQAVAFGLQLTALALEGIDPDAELI